MRDLASINFNKIAIPLQQKSCRNVYIHHGAGGYHRTIADSPARQNDGASSNACLISDPDADEAVQKLFQVEVRCANARPWIVADDRSGPEEDFISGKKAGM
jgi:hypothetical protein